MQAIANDIEVPQSAAEQVAKSQGKGLGGELDTYGTQHSCTRVAQGLTLEFVITEYRALRACVTRRWLQSTSRGGEAIEELVRFNEAVDQALVRSASEYAHRVSLERDNLEAILAHDLRSPLSAIRLSADLLKLKLSTDSHHLVLLAERCRRGSIKMERLIDSLLDVTRLRRGQSLHVEAGPMDMASLVRESLDEIIAANPKAKLHLDCPDRVSGIWDYERMGQVFCNLLTNAIKYGDPARTVAFTVVEKGETVHVDVHNYGEPIQPDEVARIFDPFMRSEQVVRQSHGGSGLGLHIVKRIVTAHHGDVVVTSSLNEGTRFEIVLPRFSLHGANVRNSLN